MRRVSHTAPPRLRLPPPLAAALKPAPSPSPSLALAIHGGHGALSGVRACRSVGPLPLLLLLLLLLPPPIQRQASRRDGRGDGASTAASYKELGLYSLKKGIEDAVVRVKTTASSVLEMEEARRIRQEEVLRGRNLWDNPAKSHEALSALADTIRVVDHLKDLRYKAEEAKLISQLSEMDVINVELFIYGQRRSFACIPVGHGNKIVRMGWLRRSSQKVVVYGLQP